MFHFIISYNSPTILLHAAKELLVEQQIIHKNIFLTVDSFLSLLFIKLILSRKPSNWSTFSVCVSKGHAAF